MTFYDRLDSLLVENREIKSRFAKTIGIQYQSLVDWKKRGTIPSADVAIKIANYFNVSVEWLITGIDNNERDKIERELISKYRCLKEVNKNVVETLINGLYEQDKKQK